MDKITDSKLLYQNRKLLDLLRFYKGIDRSEISRKLKLSMPTIYNAVDELVKVGVLRKEKTNVFINENYGTLIGLSIGSSLCKVSFLNMNYELWDKDIFAQHKLNICDKINKIISNKEVLDRCITDPDRNYVYFNTPETFSELKSILDSIFEYIIDCVQNSILNVLCIGISCTGIISDKTQTILNAHNLSYLDNSTLDSLLLPSKRLFFNQNQIYVSLIQNSNASIIAEKIDLYHSDSIYKNKENIVSIFLGVGYGAGLYLGSVYSGSSGFAGEVGHTPAPNYESSDELKEFNQKIQNNEIDSHCTCGNNNCYDYKFRSYVMGMSLKEFRNKSSDEIHDYLEKNPNKAELLGKYLGHIINTLANWLNIDLVIFTGKLYKSMDILMNYIDTTLDENPLKFNRNDCSIYKSRLGSLAPSMGAAIYAYHKKYDLELSWNY